VNTGYKKRYIRLIYRRCFHYLAAALAVCAAIGGLYDSHVHFIYALCAAGALLIGWGWLEYLRMTGFSGIWPNRKSKPIPYIHRRFKDRILPRPAFRKDFRDFDDDLTSATAADDERFSEKEARLARVWSRAACGALAILLSFVL